MEQRRLAFTDIVGYSRMVQTDEGLALELLEDHDWIVGERIDGKGGGTLKTAGDSFLASFEPAGAALAAAAAIQQALAVRNEGLPEERQLHIRICIHAADVVFTDEHEGFLYHGLCQQYLVAPEAQSAGDGAARVTALDTAVENYERAASVSPGFFPTYFDWAYVTKDMEGTDAAVRLLSSYLRAYGDGGRWGRRRAASVGSTARRWLEG